jgi:hypothetical protein
MGTDTRGARGAVLVEFALIALVFTLLLVATVDIGRLLYFAQATQDAARVAARELALAPLPPDVDFETALAAPPVVQRVFDPRYLVIDLDAFDDAAALDACAASWPLVNQALRPLMVFERVGDRQLLRLPGALLSTQAEPPLNPDCPQAGIAVDLTVGIPRVTTRDASGVETIEWVPVLEEVRLDPIDPATGPFSLASVGPQRGVVAVRINVPWQGAMMSGFGSSPDGPLEPNLDRVIVADDGEVAVSGASRPAPGALLPLDQEAGTYAGPYGLGRQLAFGQQVRPFRKLLAGQAVYRREVFAVEP